MSPKAAPVTQSKKLPSCARKPSTKAKAAKDVASEEDTPAPNKKVSKATGSHKKKEPVELSSSSNEEQVAGRNDGDNASDDADDKVE
jgi:hypothetical protein